MQKIHAVSNVRRVRTLAVSLTVLLAAATFYANNVRADDGCGAQADFLVKADPLMAPVRPADCSRLYENAADFTWPDARAQSFVVTLTYPDGRVTTNATSTNWLAWSDPLPPGDYTWTVSTVGAHVSTSSARRFTVDSRSADSNARS